MIERSIYAIKPNFNTILFSIYKNQITPFDKSFTRLLPSLKCMPTCQETMFAKKKRVRSNILRHTL